jgi:DNA polymerase-3 subunit beta
LTTTSEKGRGHEAISAKIEGEPIKIAFNIRYLNNVLRKMVSDNITMRVKSSIAPTLITANEDEETKYIISPIRVA